MSKVVNLNRFRKRRAKEEKERQAERNRRYHGRTKAERQQEEAERRRLDRKLDGAFLVRERVDVEHLNKDSVGSPEEQLRRLEQATEQVASLSEYAERLRSHSGEGERLAPPESISEDARPMTGDALLEGASDEQFDSFVRLVVLVAYADGDLAPEESDVLVERVLELSAGRVDRDRLLQLMEDFPAQSRSGSNWRVDAIAPLKAALDDAQLRLEAFHLAVRVARAHRGIGLRESVMLVNLVEQLEIDPKLAFEVMK